jgi:two-component system cell cycle response regulator
MGARILVVEDNPANLSLMEYLLKAFGHTVLSATNGEDGVAAASLEVPDVILMDLQMPKMNGYDAAARIKLIPALRHIPIVAVTAFAMVGDRDKILARGFDGYIPKPIEPETFVSQVEHFVPKHRTVPRHPPVPASPLIPSAKERPGGNRRILVVDNSPANLQLAVSTFAPLGYEVQVAGSVDDAMKSLREQPPGLILSDVHMPGQNGYEFLHLVKKDPDLRSIPFVFLSSTVWGETERMSGLGRGADGVILRPIDPEVLVAEIDKRFGKR